MMAMSIPQAVSPSSTDQSTVPMPSVVDTATVLEALQACSHVDPSIREPAEQALKQWEASSSGYLTALLAVIGNVQAMPEEVRWMAAIVLKNSIPRIWQQQQALKEEEEEEERSMVRSTLPNLLFSEPSDRMALHLRLAVASVALFDFPQQWPHVLRDLQLLAEDQARNHVVRIRAIKTLRDVLQSLQHCKIVIKTNGVRTFMEVRALAKQAMQKRITTMEATSQELPALVKGALDHVTGLAQASSNGNTTNWVLEGKLCVGYLKAIAEVLPMCAAALVKKIPTSSTTTLESALSMFFQQSSVLLDQTNQFHNCPIPNNSNAAPTEEWACLVHKVHQAVVKCCTVAVNNLPIQFAPFVDSAIRSVLEAMLKDAPHTIPLKRLAGHTRFLVTVLHSRAYFGATPSEQPALQAAQQALEVTVFSNDAIHKMVETIVTRYLKLTDTNVMEYDQDPEEWFQVQDAERTNSLEPPETPSRCGEMMLLSMMERKPDRVGQALLELAQQYQPQTNAEGLLYREACYHALEICNKWMSRSDSPLLQFGDWWKAELQILLQTSLAPTEAVPVRALQARAVQVVQAYNASLSQDDFPVAFQAVANLLVASDLDTSLNAAKCLMHLVLSALHSSQDDSLRIVEVRKHSIVALSNAFALAKRVESEECLSVALKLVSSLVEANGASLEHCLDAIAEQLPPLWERAGDGASLHSSLIAVLNHLIIKIGYTAVEHVHVQQVLFPLVDYCTDISVPHRADVLLEEGLKLWLVTLATSRMAIMGQTLTAMLPRLEAILRSGLEPHLSLEVLRLYALVMGAAQVVEPIADVVTALLLKCASYTEPTTADKEENENKMEQDNGPDTVKSSGSATLKDGIVAASFMEALMELHPTVGYAIARPSLSKLLTTIAEKQLPLPLAEGVFRALCRLLWIQPCALEGMFVGKDDVKQHVTKLVQTWLRLISISSITSVLDPRFGKLTFIKRKAAALSLCLAVCRSPHVAQWIGPTVVQYTEKLVEAQVGNPKLTMEQLMEAACGATTQQVPGDGPLGDVATRAKEMTRNDPLLTTDLKDALERARKALPIP